MGDTEREEAGTPGQEPEGGSVKQTPETPEPIALEDGTEPTETPEDRVARLEAENQKLKAGHKQWLGEKSEYERLKQAERERERQTPPTPDSAHARQRLDEAEARRAALERAALQGDPVAQAHLELQREIVLERQFAMISDAAEREEVRQFMERYPGRAADPIAGQYMLRGLKAEHERRTKQETPKPAPTPPVHKPPLVATGTGPSTPAQAGAPRKMPLSEYTAIVKQGGPRAESLRDEKDSGKIELDYAR